MQYQEDGLREQLTSVQITSTSNPRLFSPAGKTGNEVITSSTEKSSLTCSLVSEDRRKCRMVCTFKVSLQELQNSETGSEKPVAILPPPPPSG